MTSHMNGHTTPSGRDDVVLPQPPSTHDQQPTHESHAPLPEDHALFDKDHTPFKSEMVLVTEEAETLFNELMDSGSSSSDPQLEPKKSYTDLDWGLREALRGGEAEPESREDSAHLPQLSTGEEPEDSTTPKASPHTSPSNIRRWSVRKRRSYDSSDLEDSTPKASPYVRRSTTQGVGPGSGHAPSESQISDDGSLCSLNLVDPPTPFRAPTLQEVAEPPTNEGDPISNPRGSGSQDISPATPTNRETTPDPDLTPRAESPKLRPFMKSKTLPPNISFPSKYADSFTKKEEKVMSSSSSSSSLKGSGNTHIKRSKSFGNRTRVSQHQREGSLSTDNSPLPSPIFQAKRAGKGKHPSPNSSYRHAPHHGSSSSIKAGSGSSPSSGSANNTRGRGGGSPSSSARGSPAPPTVSLMGLISTTRTTPELQDIPLIQVDPQLPGQPTTADQMEGEAPIILPPPDGFEGSPSERCDSRGSSVLDPYDTPLPPMPTPTSHHRAEETKHRHEDKSLFSFLFRSKRGSRSTTPSDLEPARRSEPDDGNPALFLQPVTPPSAASSTVFSPLESRTEDVLSFEDCLETYDQYASASGRTSRSARKLAEAEISVAQPLTPNPKKKERKEKKKKKQRHGYTVANIDAETIQEVKRITAEREREREESKRDPTKVTKLAREYSQKIKDRNKLTKRFSTLAEELPPSPTPVKPVWLMELKDKRNSRTIGGFGGRRSLDDILAADMADTEDTNSIGSNDTDRDTPQPHPLPRTLSDDDLTSTGGGGGMAEKRSGRGLKKAYSTKGRPRMLFEGAEFPEQPGEGEAQKGRRFKGWVKSLATRFAKSKTDGTNL